MIIGVNKGHTLKGENTGATFKNYKEELLTREVGNHLIQILEEQAHTVIDCTVDVAKSNTEALNNIVSLANKQKLDLFVSIHFNKYNEVANGSEAFVYSYSDFIRPIGNRILLNFANLGYKNRGLKLSKDAPQGGLKVVDKTKAPAILIECCFIDNTNDMKKYDVRKMAIAIYEGITNKKYNDNKFYRVLVGSYKEKNNALNKQKELKSKGFDSSIIYTEVK